MQSWGISSRFTERDTGLEPSKSGVIGLLCAAMGKPRREGPTDGGVWPKLSDLTTMRMGVRVDRPGKMGVDFQTAGGGRLGNREYGVAKADGSGGEAVMSWRYYLQDASFLVGMESDNYDLLLRMHIALKEPVWALSLGRKSYVPSTPIHLPDGLQGGDLITVLSGYPLSNLTIAETTDRLQLILDDPNGLGEEVRRDLPLDYAGRRFGTRQVRTESVSVPSLTAQ